MTDRDGREFKIGEAFPPDSRLARWMTGCLMALNDLLLVNRWLVPRLKGEVESEGYEHLFLARLAGAELFEAATFLRKANRFEDIREFVGGLDQEAQDAYQALLKIAKGSSGDFAEYVKRARDNFSHYSELLPDEAEAGDELRRALKAHADEGTVGHIRDKTPPITGFRALFVDDVAVELAFPGDEVDLPKFVEQLSEHIASYLLFARAAVGAYAEMPPKDAWDDWIEDGET